MEQLIKDWAPNVWKYRTKFVAQCENTLQMFLIAGAISFLLGLIFGVIVTVKKEGGIRQNKFVYRLIDAIINVLRSVPFIILLIFLIPLTRALVGTAIGVQGAIVPLVFGTVPFFTRQVEAALASVSPGKIEAARSMGSGTLGIIFRIYLHEAVPDLIRVTTITAISLIGLTTMAGAVGAGGLGDLAIRYGYQRRVTSMMVVTVILIIILVQVIQSVFSWLSTKLDKRLR